MRKLFIGVAAVAMLATAAPAFAQVHLDGPGVNVRIGPGHPGYRAYGWDRDHHRDRGCRSVTVRERMPNGTTVTRTRSRC